MRWFVCVVAFCAVMMVGCKGGAGRTAAVVLQIKEVSCKVLDKICQYKDFVCAGTVKTAAPKAVKPKTP